MPIDDCVQEVIKLLADRVKYFHTLMVLVKEEINLVLFHLVCDIFRLVPPIGTGSYFFCSFLSRASFVLAPLVLKKTETTATHASSLNSRIETQDKVFFEELWLLWFLECSVFSLRVWEGQGYSDCDFQQCLYEAWITIDTATNNQFLKTFWPALFLLSTSWVDQVLHFDTR